MGDGKKMARKTVAVTEEEIAREAEKPLPWVPHDAHFRESTPAKVLQRKYKSQGRQRYWDLVEMLAAEQGHRLEVGDELVAMTVCDELGFGSVADMVSYLGFLDRLGLVRMPGDGGVTCPLVDEQARKAAVARLNGRRGGRPRKDG